MAKKQTMNFLEANFEKIIVALAIAFVAWVVFSCILNAPGVKVSGQKMSATEAAEKGAKIARNVVDELSEPGPLEGLTVYEPVGDDVMADIKPVQMDKILLTPPDIRKLILEQDIRNYAMPEQPVLSDPKILLTHAQASVPVEAESDDNNALAAFGGNRSLTYEVKDITFVTVEATIDMSALYETFEQAFTGQRVTKKMKEMYHPIVASVDLVRKELLDDGSWSAPVYIPRMSNDPMKNNFTFDELTHMSKTKHEIAMKDNMPSDIQLQMLQPRPYELIGDRWLNPTAREAASEEDEDRRGARAGVQPNQAGPAVPGMYGAGAGNRINTQLVVDDFKVWAHDETVEPGKIYSYALKVCFFNPCFETNWLNKSSQQWRLSQVFPSTVAMPENAVLTPPDSLFIPRSINDENSARIEVYKFQNGQWFKRSFSVSPGSSIGFPVTQTAYVSSNTPNTNPGMMNIGMEGGDMPQGQNPATGNQSEIEVDYAIGATVLEIKTPTTRWYKTNNGLRSELCGEIVYCDQYGQTKSITSHNAFWSDTFREMYTNVNRAYTADERRRKDQERELRNAGRR